MLTRKHFEKIAEIIAEVAVMAGDAKAVISAEGRVDLFQDLLISKLGAFFMQENPRFDRDRFIKAATQHIMEER